MWGVASFIFPSGFYPVPVGGVVHGSFENAAEAVNTHPENYTRTQHSHSICTGSDRDLLQVIIQHPFQINFLNNYLFNIYY